MLERLQRLAAQTEGVSAWKIVDRWIDSRELFFVRRKIDMHRSKTVRHTDLTVYQDFDQAGKSCRGSVTVRLHPGHTEQELRRILREGAASARYVDNAWYPLVQPGGEGAVVPSSRFAEQPLEQWLEPLSQALFQEDTLERAGINSTELFLERIESRVLNSNGVDVGFTSFRVFCELIVEARGPMGEVELFKEIFFSDFHPERLREEVRLLLALCRDRASAGPTPRLGSSTVLLSGDPVHQLFSYYLFQSSAESVYSGVSRLQPGRSVQGEPIRGDALSITLEPYLPDSWLSAPWDEDGFPLRPVSLVEGGVLLRHWGPQRFCHYLGVQPTGNVFNVSVGPGKRPAAELRRGGYLEVVAFSDFHCDPITGDFGGEVRLAYYCSDDSNPIPVTGGSVSGRLGDLDGEIYLSAETQSANAFLGPQTVKLPNLAVTGA